MATEKRAGIRKGTPVKETLRGKKPGSPKGTPGKATLRAKAQAAPRKALKMPAGERPKQLSDLAKAVKSAARGGVGVAGPSYKGEYITAGEAAVRASRIRKQEAKAAAMAKSGKASTSYSPSEMSKRAQSAMGERAMKKQLAKYGESKTEYGYKLNSGKPKSIASKVAGAASKIVTASAKALAKEPRPRGAFKVTKPSNLKKK